MSAASGMSAGTAKTPQAVEGAARQPDPEGGRPMTEFTYRLLVDTTPTEASRLLSHLNHEKQRAPIRAKCDEIRTILGMDPGPWGKRA